MSEHTTEGYINPEERDEAGELHEAEATLPASGATNELRAALEQCKEALDSIWAAIGDALCSGKGIEKAYANSVAIEARKASNAARAALAAAPGAVGQGERTATQQFFEYRCMCRNNHEQIGFNGNSCPICAAETPAAPAKATGELERLLRLGAAPASEQGGLTNGDLVALERQLGKFRATGENVQLLVPAAILNDLVLAARAVQGDALRSLRELSEKATAGQWDVGFHYLEAGVNDDSHKDWTAPDSIPKGQCALCANPEGVFITEKKTEHGNMHVHRFKADDKHDIYSPFGVQVAGNFDYEEGGIIRDEDSEFIVACVNYVRSQLAALAGDVTT